VDVGLDAVNVQGIELEGGRHGDEGAQGEEQPRVAQHDCDGGGVSSGRATAKAKAKRAAAVGRRQTKVEWWLPGFTKRVLGEFAILLRGLVRGGRVVGQTRAWSWREKAMEQREKPDRRWTGSSTTGRAGAADDGGRITRAEDGLPCPVLGVRDSNESTVAQNSAVLACVHGAR
jgi:hypothetical protein